MLVSAAAGMQHHPGTAWLDAFHAHVSAQPAQLDEVFVERVRDAFRRLDYHPEEKQGQKQGPQQHQLQRPGLRRAIPLPIIPARSTQPGLAVQQPSRARLSQEAVGPSSASSSSSSAASVCSHAVVGASLGAGGNGLSSTLQQAGVLYAARLDHADVSMSTSAAGSIASSTSSSTAATARATHQHGGGSVAGAGVQDTAAPAHSGKAQLAEEHPYSNSGFHAHASGWLHSATGSMDAADIAWACGEMVGEDSHAWMVPGQWDFEAASLAHVHAVSEEQVAVLAKPSRFGP